MTVMVWHPDKKEWVFGESKGLLFGLTGAVLACSRVPALIAAIARRWLAIPVQDFFDDFRILDIAKSNGSASTFFVYSQNNSLGSELIQPRSKNQTTKQYFSATWRHTKWTIPATQ